MNVDKDEDKYDGYKEDISQDPKNDESETNKTEA